MGLFDLFKKRQEQAPPVQQERAVEKVRAVSAADMAAFPALPFTFDAEIKYAGPGTIDPWYMDLDFENQTAAADQIGQLNAMVQQAYLLSNDIPLGLCIPENRIVYAPKGADGYTRLICAPFTDTGKKAKYPCSLVFTTDYIPGCQTTGRIDYAQDGTMGKAKVSLWNNHVLYALSYKTVGRSFVLGEAKTNAGLALGDPLKVIYKA